MNGFPRLALLTCGGLLAVALAAPAQYPAQCYGPRASYSLTPAPDVTPFTGGSYSFHPPGYSYAPVQYNYYRPPVLSGYSAPDYVNYYGHTGGQPPRYLDPGPYYYTRWRSFTPGYYSYYDTPGYFRY